MEDAAEGREGVVLGSVFQNSRRQVELPADRAMAVIEATMIGVKQTHL